MVKFVLPQMLSVVFIQCTKPGQFPRKHVCLFARNPTSTPTNTKNTFFIVNFRGHLVFIKPGEYIPRCFLCLDYIYLHEFGETWPRAHDQGEINGFDVYIPIFPVFCSFWCERSKRPMNGDG